MFLLITSVWSGSPAAAALLLWLFLHRTRYGTLVRAVTQDREMLEALGVTPEATEAVCDRVLPGFGELMRATSLIEVPTAILSRQIAGTRGSSLIINLPGKPAAIRTCLDAVFAAVPYCIDLIGGDRLETNPEFCVAFRPKS